MQCGVPPPWRDTVASSINELAAAHSMIRLTALTRQAFRSSWIRGTGAVPPSPHPFPAAPSFFLAAERRRVALPHIHTTPHDRDASPSEPRKVTHTGLWQGKCQRCWPLAIEADVERGKEVMYLHGVARTPIAMSSAFTVRHRSGDNVDSSTDRSTSPLVIYTYSWPKLAAPLPPVIYGRRK